MPEDTIIQRMSAAAADLAAILQNPEGSMLGEDEGHDAADALVGVVDEFLSQQEQDRDPDIEVTVTLNDGSRATWWLTDDEWASVEIALGRQPDSQKL